MNFTILGGKKLGRITFSRPFGGYIYADLNGQSGALGIRICYGGKTTGNTLAYSGDSDAEFKATCRRWYSAFMSHNPQTMTSNPLPHDAEE
jgi:hypothetical protein